MSLLASVHQLVFDKKSNVFSKHPLTTDEIKRSCEDIKVYDGQNPCLILCRIVQHGLSLLTLLHVAGSWSEGVEAAGEVESKNERVS